MTVSIVFQNCIFSVDLEEKSWGGVFCKNQNKMKKLLTFWPLKSIVLSAVRAADRKVGIHLTLARVSDPGS